MDQRLCCIRAILSSCCRSRVELPPGQIYRHLVVKGGNSCSSQRVLWKQVVTCLAYSKEQLSFVLLEGRIGTIGQVTSWTWPTISSDLLSTEHAWDELKRGLQQRWQPPRTAQNLLEAVVQEWRNIPLEPLGRFIQFMRCRCRCQAVPDSLCGHTQCWT